VGTQSGTDAFDPWGVNQLPVFQSKSRTVESYLAGAGASGSLLAGAFIAFVLLVGAATFDAWPHYGHLLPGAGVTLNTTTSGGPSSAPSPRVGSLPRGRGIARHGHGTRVPAHDEGQQGAGAELGGNEITGGGAAPQSPVQNTAQPAPPSGSGSTNIVQRTVSDVGNVVEADTATVGDNLSATSPQVGTVVSGLGGTLNSTLQGLAGNP
jgi:hypothetical protein